MRAGAGPGAAAVGDGIPLRHPLADLHIYGAQVGVPCFPGDTVDLAVQQYQIIPVVGIIIAFRHHAVRRGQHSGALGCRQVHAGVGIGKGGADLLIIGHRVLQRKGQGFVQCADGIVLLGGGAAVDQLLPLLVGRLSVVALAMVGGKPARRGQGVVHKHFKMTVIASGLPCIACIADDLPLDNTLPGFHSIALQVGIQSAPAVPLGVGAVVNHHKVTVAVVFIGGNHNAVGGCQHIGAFSSVQIVAAVAVVFKAGNVGVIRHGVDKQRAVRGIFQQRQLRRRSGSGRGGGHRFGSFAGRGGFSGLRRGGGRVL